MKINMSKLTNKNIYETLTFSKATPSAENKWVEYYPFLDTINWSNIYSLCSTVTTNSKLRSLQYSIIHRIFSCKYNLYLWNITETSECWYCNETDTIEHYFFYCNQSESMWKEIGKIVQNALGMKVNLTVLEILLGIPCRKYTLHHILNLLILFTKQFIYLQKKQLNAIFPRLLFSNLKGKIEIEMYLIKSSQNFSISFLEKWERVFTYITSML